MEYQYGSAHESSSRWNWMIFSNAARYIRCHGRKNQLPCWQLLQNWLLMSGSPFASARPWMAAWKRHPSGSAGGPLGSSRPRIVAIARS